MNALIPINLFLDDLRNPKESYLYTKNDIYLNLDWDIVRNYTSFVDLINKFGMPQVISFDHDLCEEHIAPVHLWNDYKKSKAWQDRQVFTEKTGYQCARFVFDYCMQTKIKAPIMYCHSQNPVGADKINRVIEMCKSKTIKF